MNPVFDPLQRKMVSGPEAGQNVDVDGFEVSFSGSTTGGVYNAAAGLSLTGNTFSVAPGYRMNTSGGTVNQDRFFPIETVSGTSVTLQAGHAYIINATTSAGITLNCESFAANTFGLEGHATIYTANAGYVQQGANVYLADPLEPDAVNNCTIRFHGGSATVSVEDYFGGYIVLSGGTGSGSLPYGLASAGSQYIGFNASLNGQTLNLSGAVANGEKHVVGNGCGDTILTGAVNCGSSSFTVANLSLANVQITGGVMTFGDAYIPSGSTVAVSGGGLAVEKVTGAGSASVIDLGGTNVICSGIATCNASGCTFVSGYGAGSGGGVFFNSNTRFAHIQLTDCEISGCSATHAGAVLVAAASATLTNCDVIGNRADGLGGGIMIGAGKAFLSGCTITDNFASNTATTPPANDLQFNGDGSAVLLGGNTIGHAQMANGGNVTMSGTNKVTGVFQYRGSANSGSVTLTSGAILDLTGNENPTPINPGGGITFEQGGATILTGGTAGVVDAQYTLGGMTVPTIGNTNVVNLSGTHITVSSGTATASNAIFSGGSGTNGGGIAVVNGAIVTLTECTITGCTAQSYGKGMYLSRGFATLSSCTLETNGDASQPEIVVRASSTLTVSGGSVRRIDLYDGTASIAGTVTLGAVSATANTDGGPLTISSGAAITLTDSIVPGGIIEVSGGTCTVNGHIVESGTYTTINANGSTVPPQN